MTDTGSHACSLRSPHVSIDTDNCGESVLTSKAVLVSDPNNISNSHIPVSRVPLGPWSWRIGLVLLRMVSESLNTTLLSTESGEVTSSWAVSKRSLSASLHSATVSAAPLALDLVSWGEGT